MSRTVVSLERATREPVTARLTSFLRAEDSWVRPAPESMRSDVRLGVGFWGVGAFMVELARIMGLLHDLGSPAWAQHAAVAVGTLMLIWRRRFPIVIAAAGGLHMFVVGVTQPALMGLPPLQVAYFVTIYTAVAWARDRQAMVLVVSLVVLLLLLWLSVQVVFSSGIERLLPPEQARGASLGPITPAGAAGMFVFIVNIAYFGGAITLGQLSWHGARQTALVAEQRTRLAEQAERLREQALVEERLRIARELHDVVAHHVSVMGVQAGAARTVLQRDPEKAVEALRVVEDSSREAVTQMRGLLGTLRRNSDGTDDSLEVAGREPQPGLGQLTTLVADASSGGLQVSYDLVEDTPDAAADVAGAVGVAIYRIVQEALTNVRRHSSANTASVVVRIAAGYVEAEVLDNGQPTGAGSIGTGLGQLGMRERVHTLGGIADIGPRATGGYRVRVRFPRGTR